jgi:hypothetical protein
MKEVLHELKLMATFFLIFSGFILSVLFATWLAFWAFYIFFTTLP